MKLKTIEKFFCFLLYSLYQFDAALSRIFLKPISNIMRLFFNIRWIKNSLSKNFLDKKNKIWDPGYSAKSGLYSYIAKKISRFSILLILINFVNALYRIFDIGKSPISKLFDGEIGGLEILTGLIIWFMVVKFNPYYFIDEKRQQKHFKTFSKNSNVLIVLTALLILCFFVFLFFAFFMILAL